MNSLARSSMKVLSSAKPLANKIQQDVQSTVTRSLTRSLVVLASPTQSLQALKNVTPGKPCGCGCGIMQMHTKGDREIVEFLQGEITAEKENQKGEVTSKLGDFDIKYEGAEVVLTRTFNDEKIIIETNVNHSVDDSIEGEDDAQLSCKPDFHVNVEIGSKTLSFTLGFITDAEAKEMQGESEDTYGISEVMIYSGEHNEKVYAVSGEILDVTLYDLFMNMLQERGVTSAFAANLSELLTSYEHSQYINLLQSVQEFVKRK